MFCFINVFVYNTYEVVLILPKIMARKKEKIQSKKEVLRKTVDEITRRRTFEPFNQPTVGCRFLRLNKHGQSVVGQLGFPIRNFRQTTSYPLQLEDGEVVEILGNRLLHKQIAQGELCGRRVEIIYQGREYTRYGHYRKIYRVFEIGHEQMSKEVWEKIAAELKKEKKDDRE